MPGVVPRRAFPVGPIHRPDNPLLLRKRAPFGPIQPGQSASTLGLNFSNAFHDNSSEYPLYVTQHDGDQFKIRAWTWPRTDVSRN